MAMATGLASATAATIYADMQEACSDTASLLYQLSQTEMEGRTIDGWEAHMREYAGLFNALADNSEHVAPIMNDEQATYDSCMADNNCFSEYLQDGYVALRALPLHLPHATLLLLCCSTLFAARRGARFAEEDRAAPRG